MKASISLVLMCLTLLYSNFASAVLIDKRDWRQLTDTTGFSWDEIAGVCPTNGTACAGTLEGVNFTGWTWASIEEISDLFIAFSDGAFPGGRIRYFELNSIWAVEFLDVFEATQVSTNVVGWSSTTAFDDPTKAAYAFVSNQPPDSFPDQMATNFDFSKTRDNLTWGTWLYQEVPEPSTISLLVVSFAAAGVVVRLRRRERRCMPNE